ncbi:hypothetical protein CLV80_10577 [Yoonia maritima]|uniref:FlgN protein n=1 Tax=Yoonia maritima TaxID=1435347 RepID=A0A2T0VYZ8_9RHOB|nr:hypothetical protein [Yoonia maritima]PRY77594.1 hypothetical protein CLV80_10577 [Yoonia maritima]
MRNSVTKRLIQTLKAEKSALREASFDVLGSLEKPKSELFKELAESAPDANELRAVQLAVTENQTLLSAAIAGIGAARARIEALQNVRSGLNVYDKSGAISKMANPQPEIEKKA